MKKGFGKKDDCNLILCEVGLETFKARRYCKLNSWSYCKLQSLPVIWSALGPRFMEAQVAGTLTKASMGMVVPRQVAGL